MPSLQDVPLKYLTRAINYLRDHADAVPAKDRKTADGMSGYPKAFETGRALDRQIRSALQLIGSAIESGAAKSSRDYLNEVGRELRALDTDCSGALSEEEMGPYESRHPLLRIARSLHGADHRTDSAHQLGDALMLARLKLQSQGRNSRAVLCQIGGEVPALRIFDPDPDACFRLLGGRGRLEEGDQGRLQGEIFDGKVTAQFVTGPLR